MSFKHSLDGQTGSETKKQKREMDSFKYYPHNEVFEDTDDQRGMKGNKNFHLAKSFVYSRYKNWEEFGDNENSDNFSRNAGALQLYHPDGETLFKIRGQSELKEYNCVSAPIYNPDDRNLTTYGHSERRLMRMVLDDLISADLTCSDGQDEEIKRPSDDHTDNEDEQKKEYEIMKNLTDKDKADIYKKYLEKKRVIVKMWSERPNCPGVDKHGNPIEGGACGEFMQRICPANSQFGYITPPSMEVKDTFEEFKIAYSRYSTSLLKMIYSESS